MEQTGISLNDHTDIDVFHRRILTDILGHNPSFHTSLSSTTVLDGGRVEAAS